jgi:hypothetical protein
MLCEGGENVPVAGIEVEAIGAERFRVRVIDENNESLHLVTLAAADYQRIGAGKISRENLIKRSFEFLLRREAKESILAEFDLMAIGHYFPEYEAHMRRAL